MSKSRRKRVRKVSRKGKGSRPGKKFSRGGLKKRQMDAMQGIVNSDNGRNFTGSIMDIASIIGKVAKEGQSFATTGKGDKGGRRKSGVSIGLDKDSFKFRKIIKGHPKDCQLAILNGGTTTRMGNGGTIGQQIGGTELYWQGSDLAALNAVFTSASVHLSQSIFYKSLKIEKRHVNMANTQATIRYYILKARYDGSGSNPIGVWQNGVTDQGETGAASFPDSTPFQSRQFCQNYKVHKVFKKVLDPGERWDVNINLNLNRTLSSWRQSIAPNVMGGITWYIMWMIYGGIENDSTTKTQISYAVPGVDCITKTSYEAWLKPRDDVIMSNVATYVPTSFTVAGEAMDLMTDALEANIVA